MHRRTAFTLIELLVVISIMSMLTMLVMPSMYRVKELTRCGLCTANLRALHNGVFLFAGNRPQEHRPIPTVTDTTTTEMASVGMTSTGTTGSGGATVTYKSLSSAWYAMAQEASLSYNCFGCPSDGGLQPAGGDYDFLAVPTSTPISYSFQVSWTSHRTFNLGDVAELALVADNNGLMSWSWTGGYQKAVRNTAVPCDNSAAGNSINHGRDGQMVCYFGGQVLWKRDPMCGIEGENIYAPAGQIDSATGKITSSTDPTTPSSSFPQSDTDSFLLP